MQHLHVLFIYGAKGTKEDAGSHPAHREGLHDVHGERHPRHCRHGTRPCWKVSSLSYYILDPIDRH